MKTYLKSIFKTLKSNITRITIITAIIAVGVGLSTGLGSVPSQIKDSFADSLSNSNFSDIIIKSRSNLGFSQTDIDKINSKSFINNSSSLTEIDDLTGVRTYYLNFDDNMVNKIELLEGRLPLSSNEIVVERKTNYIKDYKVGDVIKYQGQDLEIVGIVVNPLLLYKNEIPSNIENVTLNTVMYFDNQYINFPIITDLQIKLNVDYDIFSKDYQNYVLEKIEELKYTLQSEAFVYLTHKEMITPTAVSSNAEKINVISLIFPIFFTFVIIIVVLTTMTRLIEDDRIIAGAFLSLGFSHFKIKVRYYMIAIISGILGGGVGIVLGYNILARLIYDAFNALFIMPKPSGNIHIGYGLIISLIIILAMLITILFISRKMFKEKPASLLRQKSPKPGSKIFLEKIPFIWKRLKFKYKSSLRNIFRYPTHFFMTVISVAGATALVFAGLGLYDNTVIIKDSSAKSIELIAIIIIIAAALLSILVTYNLTNMNIEERKREIATLKVLGSKKMEVAGYIFREVFITATIGILIGLPLGYLLVGVIFDYVDFGSLKNINLATWFITLAVSFLFIVITDLLLYKKIDNIDMNASLKTIE